MSNPGQLVLQILDEGRINVAEAVELLAAIGNRIAVRSRPVTTRTPPTGTTDFLPVTLSTAWSGSIREVI
jgi:hypothetical protein